MDIQGFRQLGGTEQTQAQPSAQGGSALQAGDTLRAEVSAFRDGVYILRASDGKQFTAQSERPLQPGQLLELTVTNVQNGQPQVELSAAHGVRVDSFLAALGGDSSPEAKALAKELIGTKTGVTKKQFAALVKALRANPSLKPDQAAFMLRHKIPINAETVESYRALSRQESGLGAKLSALLDALGDAPGQGEEVVGETGGGEGKAAEKASSNTAPKQNLQSIPSGTGQTGEAKPQGSTQTAVWSPQTTDTGESPRLPSQAVVGSGETAAQSPLPSDSPQAQSPATGAEPAPAQTGQNRPALQVGDAARLSEPFRTLLAESSPQPESTAGPAGQSQAPAAIATPLRETAQSLTAPQSANPTQTAVLQSANPAVPQNQNPVPPQNQSQAGNLVFQSARQEQAAPQPQTASRPNPSLAAGIETPEAAPPRPGQAETPFRTVIQRPLAPSPRFAAQLYTRQNSPRPALPNTPPSTLGTGESQNLPVNQRAEQTQPQATAQSPMQTTPQTQSPQAEAPQPQTAPSIQTAVAVSPDTAQSPVPAQSEPQAGGGSRILPQTNTAAVPETATQISAAAQGGETVPAPLTTGHIASPNQSVAAEAPITQGATDTQNHLALHAQSAPQSPPSLLSPQSQAAPQTPFLPQSQAAPQNQAMPQLTPGIASDIQPQGIPQPQSSLPAGSQTPDTLSGTGLHTDSPTISIPLQSSQSTTPQTAVPSLNIQPQTLPQSSPPPAEAVLLSPEPALSSPQEPPSSPQNLPLSTLSPGVETQAPPEALSFDPQAEIPPEAQNADGNSPRSASELLDALFRRVSPERRRTLPAELNIHALKREIGELVEAASRQAEDMPEAQRTAVTKAIRDLTQTLRFTEQMNAPAAFVQIPLSIGGERTTANLTVYDNPENRGKKIDPENATMFLSLKTISLGQVEGLAKLYGKRVECDFTLRSEEAATLFRQNLPELSGLLEAFGYRLERGTVAVGTEESDPAAIERIASFRQRRAYFDKSV